MPAVNWAGSQNFYTNKRSEINSNATGSGWLYFLDAFGYMESSNSYSAVNGSFRGKYQIGQPLLSDIGFFNSGGIGPKLLDVFNFDPNRGHP